MYALACYRSVSRKVPVNYILISLFTVTEAFIVSLSTMLFEPKIVIIVASLTAGIVISLTIYAITTKKDFTYCGGFLYMCCFVLIFTSILGFFYRSMLYEILFISFSVMLFGFYLIYDV